MKIMEALKPVFIHGEIVKVGERFSCSIEFSEKLIAGDSAKVVDLNKENLANLKQAGLMSDPNIEKLGSGNSPEIILPLSNLNSENLESKTKDDLLKIVAELKIETVNKSNNKAEIIDVILKKVAETE